MKKILAGFAVLCLLTGNIFAGTTSGWMNVNEIDLSYVNDVVQLKVSAPFTSLGSNGFYYFNSDSHGTTDGTGKLKALQASLMFAKTNSLQVNIYTSNGIEITGIDVHQ
jgi:hypothetical protein